MSFVHISNLRWHIVLLPRSIFPVSDGLGRIKVLANMELNDLPVMQNTILESKVKKKKIFILYPENMSS